MTELEPKKFLYKKDQLDWVVVWIIIFTIACFALIFYGGKLFKTTNYYSSDKDQKTDLQDFQRNAQELQRQIDEYLSDNDYTGQN